jgi:hypothetical protein
MQLDVKTILLSSSPHTTPPQTPTIHPPSSPPALHFSFFTFSITFPLLSSFIIPLWFCHIFFFFHPLFRCHHSIMYILYPLLWFHYSCTHLSCIVPAEYSLWTVTSCFHFTAGYQSPHLSIFQLIHIVSASCLGHENDNNTHYTITISTTLFFSSSSRLSMQHPRFIPSLLLRPRLLVSCSVLWAQSRIPIFNDDFSILQLQPSCTFLHC